MNISGMIVTAGEKKSIRRKPSATFSSTNLIRSDLSLKLGLHGERFSRIIAAVTYYLFIYIYHARIPL
jgi:hypothetical protein